MDFISLPAELRCIIYGHLFADLVNPHHLQPDLYRLPEDWPRNDFTAYLALIRTCKLVHNEAAPYFEKHFLPGLTLHFHNVSSLHKIAKTLPPATPYQKIRFVFVTRCELFCHHAAADRGPIEDFLEQQPGGSDLLGLNWYGRRHFEAKRPGRYVCGGCGIEAVVKEQGRAGSLVHAYNYRERKSGMAHDMTLVIRGIWNEEDEVVARRTWYHELGGPILGLEWTKWEDDKEWVEKVATDEEEGEVERRMGVLRRWTR